MKRIEFITSIQREMNYWLFLPDTYNQSLPLIVYLHGAGERGKNIEHLTRHAVPKLLTEGMEIQAAVLCPQCPSDCVWDNLPHQLKDLIDEIVGKYAIDTNRITVTGSSMGGFGTWMLGMTYPNFFAAIAPVAGGGMEWRASNLLQMPIRAYHGKRDEIVAWLHTEIMVQRIKQLGGNVESIYFDNLSHNDGIEYAYSETDLLNWLLLQRKEKRFEVKEFLWEMF